VDAEISPNAAAMTREIRRISLDQRVS